MRRRRGPSKVLVSAIVVVGLVILGVSFSDNLPFLQKFLPNSGEYATEWEVYQTAVRAVKQRVKKPEKAEFLSRSAAVKDVYYDENQGLYMVDSWFKQANFFDGMEEARFVAQIGMSGGEPHVITVEIQAGGFGRMKHDFEPGK